MIPTTQQSGDCNDDNAAIHPGAVDIRDDGIDQDCDGYDLKTWYYDADGDGFGTPIIYKLENTHPAYYVSNSTDCDDSKLLYADNDNDGFGAGEPVACGVPNDTDCNDGDASIHASQTYYLDNDKDGFGDANAKTEGCTSEPPSGYVTNNTDCNDKAVTYEDKDGDGYGSNTKVACGDVTNNQDCNDGDETVYSSAITCPVVPVQCYNSSGTYAIAPLNTSKDCDVTGVSYSISGATTRNGTGNNASGEFNMGTSTITWTVSHSNGEPSICQSTVIVNPQTTVSVPDVKVLSKGVSVNTVYVGYAPASSLTLTTQASGGGTLAYKWSTGATTPSIKVSPIAMTTYTVTVKDGTCSAMASKQVKVVDVRCGSKKNKILVCHSGGTLCVDKSGVPDHLKHGDKLGVCGAASMNTLTFAQASQPIDETALIAASLYPSPNNGRFSVHLTTHTAGMAQVLVLDAQGQVVEKRNVQLTTGVQTLGFNLVGKASGLYLVKVISADGVQTLKAAVQR